MKTRWILIAGLLTAVLLSSAPAVARDPHETVDSANVVLKEFLDLQLKGIPASLLAEAHGVAIVPDVIKLGFVVGGQRGKGLIVIREKDGSWRAPTFITLTGGSIGWQIGAQSTDFVLVFKTQKSVEGLLRGKFTIGADAAAAAGPVGRRAGAATDGELKAEIYTYSRTRGLFAGVSLDGSVLDVDEPTNAAYYGVLRPGEPAPAVPEAALKLTQLIAQLAANPELVETNPGQRTSIGEPTPAVPFNRLPAAGAIADGPVLLPAQPQPAADVEAIRQELARAAGQLHALVDRNWQRYLAIPAEIVQPGKRPAAKDLKAALTRFDAVAGDARYRVLVERPEFQATRELLAALLASVESQAAPHIALPPPPGSNR